jgi:hypothetical protein
MDGVSAFFGLQARSGVRCPYLHPRNASLDAKYVNKYVELYNTGQDLVGHGYCGIDEGSRVRKFLHGIKTDSLNVVKNQILSDQSHAKDFDRAANQFKDFLAQKRSLNQVKDNTSANIAAVESTGHKRRRNNASKPHVNRGNDKRRRGLSSQVAGVTVKNLYYAKEEYPSFQLGIDTPCTNSGS